MFNKYTVNDRSASVGCDLRKRVIDAGCWKSYSGSYMRLYISKNRSLPRLTNILMSPNLATTKRMGTNQSVVASAYSSCSFRGVGVLEPLPLHWKAGQARGIHVQDAVCCFEARGTSRSRYIAGYVPFGGWKDR
jgi:hypothetical protein